MAPLEGALEEFFRAEASGGCQMKTKTATGKKKNEAPTRARKWSNFGINFKSGGGDQTQKLKGKREYNKNSE